ncbi:MAG: hypothetical protein ACP5XB_30380 [Isosphaeraceae bacterium]
MAAHRITHPARNSSAKLDLMDSTSLAGARQAKLGAGAVEGV